MHFWYLIGVMAFVALLFWFIWGSEELKTQKKRNTSFKTELLRKKRDKRRHLFKKTRQELMARQNDNIWSDTKYQK